jgi:hypothetical protein
MSTNFESELDILLNENAEKKKLQLNAQIKAKNETDKFIEEFKEAIIGTIRPSLENIKLQLDKRKMPCRIEEYINDITHNGKERHMFISIYFNISPNKHVGCLNEYPHVTLLATNTANKLMFLKVLLGQTMVVVWGLLAISKQVI